MNLNKTASRIFTYKRIVSFALTATLAFTLLSTAIEASAFTINDRVQVSSGPLNVRSKPSTVRSSTILGTQQTGALGTVIAGPTVAKGYTWWKVDYDTGADGWSIGNYLTLASVAPTTVTTLSNGVTLSNLSAATNEQHMYSLTVPAGAANLRFVSSGGTGDIDLYVKFGSQPTITAYDLKSNGATTAETISIAAPQAGTYYLLTNAWAAYSGVSLVGAYNIPVDCLACIDSQLPTTPTGLGASAVSSSQINLSWSASTDNVGVVGYKIYRNGMQVGTSTATSYSSNFLMPSTAYTYTVAAYDAAGNTSAQSASVSAATWPGIVSVPPPPGTPDMVVTSASMSPGSPVTGTPITFSATIKNQGTAPTPAGVISGVVFTVDGTAVTWSDNNTQSIAPGASVTVTANGGPAGIATWSGTAGSHSLDTWVNDANRYPELSTTNNHLVTSFTVRTVSVGTPDMIVTSASITPGNPVAGTPITFSATIKNQGTAATPAGVINGVVFSVDGTDVSWSDNNTQSIAPGASVTVTANGGPAGIATWSGAAGTHSLDTWVNDANRYPELSITNNHLVTSFTVGTSPASPPPPPPGTPGPYGQDATQYTLTFDDEFNGTSLDMSKWNDHIWYEPSSATRDYAVSNGSLKIWPQPGYAPRTLTTGGASDPSMNKYFQTYGYFETEAKLPLGGGWPAFWLLNSDTGPTTGAEPEIDVLEAYPGDTTGYWADSNFHPIRYEATYFQNGANQSGLQASKSLVTPDLSAGFHKYGVYWTPNNISFYFDGVMFQSAAVTMSKQMYILLDMAYAYSGGTGTPAGSMPTGQGSMNSFEVNYVRAWQHN